MSRTVSEVIHGSVGFCYEVKLKHKKYQVKLKYKCTDFSANYFRPIFENEISVLKILIKSTII